MEQIKIFTSREGSGKEIQNKVNAWLKKNRSKISVERILQSSALNASYYYVTITIVYIDKP
jgi:hypothetical protein